MKTTVQYSSQKEREELINTHKHLHLIEEKNITEGNFLVFSDDPENDTKQIVNVIVPEEEFNEIKSRQDATDAAVLQLMMEGMMQ